jgi:hypothetical protein
MNDPALGASPVHLSGQGITLFQLPNTLTNSIANHYRRLTAEVKDRVNNRDAFLNGTSAS